MHKCRYGQMLTFECTAPLQSCPLYSALLLDDTLHKPTSTLILNITSNNY